MRKVMGIGCVVLGVVCLIASVGWIQLNRWEDKSAQESSQDILYTAQLAIREQELPPQQAEPDTPAAEPEEPDFEMPTVSVDGYECIGILSIPVLELELPVFTQWSYAKLKIAPCHYYGSYKSSDLVIAAHNYKAHFGRLSELQPQDLILFTDAAGTVHRYEVFLLETLAANATAEMIGSGFDLSLYTCTPSGTNRVTVRCLEIDSAKPQ